MKIAGDKDLIKTLCSSVPSDIMSENEKNKLIEDNNITAVIIDINTGERVDENTSLYNAYYGGDTFCLTLKFAENKSLWFLVTIDADTKKINARFILETFKKVKVEKQWLLEEPSETYIRLVNLPDLITGEKEITERDYIKTLLSYEIYKVRIGEDTLILGVKLPCGQYNIIYISRNPQTNKTDHNSWLALYVNTRTNDDEAFLKIFTEKVINYEKQK